MMANTAIRWLKPTFTFHVTHAVHGPTYSPVLLYMTYFPPHSDASKKAPGSAPQRPAPPRTATATASAARTPAVLDNLPVPCVFLFPRGRGEVIRLPMEREKVLLLFPHLLFPIPFLSPNRNAEPSHGRRRRLPSHSLLPLPKRR